MLNTKSILSNRKSEIFLYLKHLHRNECNFDSELFKILKSNTILMLYNVVEAVVSSSIQDIREFIYSDNSTHFDHLRDEIKIQIIKDLKSNISPKSLIDLSNTISKDIIKFSFSKDKISNGNISRKTIKELSELYGFIATGSNYTKTKDGIYLNEIKLKRNDLAHGTFSFSEIGKNYTLEDIKIMFRCTIKFLEFIINNIETYLQNKEYKKQAI